MSETPLVYCFLCRLPIRVGPQINEIRRIPQWTMTVCNDCYNANRRGIVPRNYPQIVTHLEAKGISFEYNANGAIDWPY